LIGIAGVLTALLHLFSTRTRFGLATRGVAENQRTAAAVGWSPDYVATVNWAVSAALAALAGLLLIPITSLSTTTLTWLVVPALAVALLGGFSSFPLAFGGAVLLGMVQGVLTQYQTNVPGLSDSVPFAIILIALVLRRQALPARGEVLHRLPSLGAGTYNPFVVAATFAVGILGSLFLPAEWAISLGISVVVGIIVLSLVVVTGYAGQLSLGQYALAGMGALIAAQLVTRAHWPFAAGMLLGVIGAALCGLVFGLPSLRSRGAALAIVTLGMGTAVQSLIFSNSTLAGGASGFDVNHITFLGLKLDPIGSPRVYTIFVLCWFALSALAISNLRRSRAGRRLISIRANERAATSLGINVGAAKLYAFVASAAFAGLGGILLAFSGGSLLLSQGFDSLASVTAVMLSVVGGIAHVSGATFGGQLAAGGLPGGLIANHVGGSNGAEWLTLIGGVLLLLTLRLNPDGVAGGVAQTNRAIAKAFRKRRRRPTPSVDAPAAPAHEEGPAEAAAAESMSSALSALERRADSRLVISKLAVNFGGVRALRGVDLEVHSGQIFGLIGPNGSGKTTLIDGVTGYVKSSGQVEIGDVRADMLAPHKRVRAGITRSFQSLELFDDVSVEENLRAAADDHDQAAWASAMFPARKQPLSASVRSVVEEFNLNAVLAVAPRELSYGQRRLVAIARAVATSPSFLLLDEPAAGLGAAETAELSHLVTRLAREWNIGILLIEHDMNMVLGICDRIAVLDFGDKIAEGTPDEIRTNPLVVAAYLGAQSNSNQAAIDPTLA
jgi:sulfate-transporting ATPase